MAYTWSRLISSTLNQDTEGKNNPVQNAYNLAAEKALGTQDQPQTLTLNFIYDLPFFKNSANPFAKQTLGGWEIVGIYTARSGLPTTVCTDHDVVGLNDGGDICERPDVIAAPNLDSSKRTINRCPSIPMLLWSRRLEPSAIRLEITFADRGLTILTSPSSRISRCRGSPVEAAKSPKLQFRAEFFNFLNHTNAKRARAGRWFDAPVGIRRTGGRRGSRLRHSVVRIADLHSDSHPGAEYCVTSLGGTGCESAWYG